MLALADYAQYVETVAKPLEAQPGCKACEKNRSKLERAWQTVANEMYLPKSRGGFSQAAWGGELLVALRGAGGALEDFRRALRRPLPAEREYLQRQFVGIGLQLGEPSAAGWTVAAPLAGSPAEEAGIRRGSVLVSVDGVSVRGLPRKEVESLLRGPAGSVADLDIASPPADTVPPAATTAATATTKPQTKRQPQLASFSSSASTPSTTAPAAAAEQLFLERRELPLPAVQWTPLTAEEGTDKLIEYVRVNYFSNDGTRALARAIVEGESLGVDGYVLDVRNNPGGVLEEGIASASLFLPCGSRVATSIRGEDAPDITYITCRLPTGQFEDLPVQLTTAPVAVLANTNSASASEVFAAALRDNGRGPIIGERTFGKGLVQFFFPLGDGSGLKLSVLKWVSPGGSDTDAQVGLAPDVACSDFPRGVVRGGPVDACIVEAERRLEAVATSAAAAAAAATASAARS